MIHKMSLSLCPLCLFVLEPCYILCPFKFKCKKVRITLHTRYTCFFMLFTWLFEPQMHLLYEYVYSCYHGILDSLGPGSNNVYFACKDKEWWSGAYNTSAFLSVPKLSSHKLYSWVLFHSKKYKNANFIIKYLQQ